ncbi:MAG TPA: LLM class flavin-dependent oxidoreductase [Thermomicrobiales bacterium]|jgi:5,10-methylenetetrahydromethanopterin reductase|nr:LLM class flavin-dependent oxidoreductase [Thermomicrobiales bacterium]
MEPIGLELAGTPSVPAMMRLAALAERLGYDSIWLTETRFTRDAVTTAAAVAAATERVRIGTAVVNPYTRGAALTAVTVATLDELAGGRLVAGIGPGSPLILAQQGYAFDRPLRRLEEMVAVIRAILAGGPVDFLGETVEIRGLALDFAPVRASVPIHLGVTGPKALALAGRIADGVILNGFVSEDYTRRAVGIIRESATAAGRDSNDVEMAGSVVVSVDPDERRAFDAVRAFVATYLTRFPNIARESGLPDSLLDAIRAAYDRDRDEAAALVSNEIVDALVCVGAPARVRDRIAARRRAGVALPVVGPVAADLAWAVEALRPG